MPNMLDIACPNCRKGIKVPVEFVGKKVKCKNCEQPFAVKDPGGAKPQAKPKAEMPKPEPKKKGRWEDEEDDETAKKPMEVIAEADDPRCPHCAELLDPPDALVCTACGFNNRTRVKAETKKVWAPTFGDWAAHLGPGIVALAIVITLIVVDVICFLNMREWLAGSFLEMDEKSLAGETKFFIPPSAFSVWIAVMSLIGIVPGAKYAYRRLIREFKPEEQKKIDRSSSGGG